MLTVHIISDSIGNTAKDVVDAALIQFSYGQVKYKVLKMTGDFTAFSSPTQNHSKENLHGNTKTHSK